MNNPEKEIREHLKTLTFEDIADSSNLFGVDFDTESLDVIFDKLITMYESVKVLKSMIDNNFKNNDGPKVLMPSSPQTQSLIIRDCYGKESVLKKILSNKVVYDQFVARLKERNCSLEKETGRPR